MKRAVKIGFSVLTVLVLLIVFIVFAALKVVESFSNHAFADHVAVAVGGDSRLTLYEGLPHDQSESELFETEKKEKSTVERRDFFFYEETLLVSNEDEEEFRRFSKAIIPIADDEEPRACPPIHPDYELVWVRGPNKASFVVCFGCQVIIVSAGGRDKECVVPNFTEFASLLKKHRNQRPVPEILPW